MPKKVETVCYCDRCTKRLEDSQVLIECENPAAKFAESPLGSGLVGGMSERHYTNLDAFESVATIRNLFVSKNKLTLKAGVLCQNCVAQLLGFGSWERLVAAAQADERRDERTER